jgi:phosphatidylglycerophosphatase A
MFRTLSSLAKAIATALGAGYSPIAPGTCGTAVTVPLALALAPLPLWQYLIVLVAVTLVGIWAAGRADRAWGTHDSGRIVVDEVAGYLTTMALVDRGHWIPLVVGFVVFRVLDIVKPPPIRWLDRNVPGGFGVVIDDVAALAWLAAL